jgi:hypothetical protein
MAEQAIEPVYTTERPNAQIDLYNGDLELRVPLLMFGRGDIAFLWQPYIRMRFRLDPIGAINPRILMSLNEGHAILNIPTVPPTSCDVYITDNSTSVISGGQITVKLGGTTVNNRQREADCDEITFHIANMRDYIGTVINYGPDQFSRYARRISGRASVSLNGNSKA